MTLLFGLGGRHSSVEIGSGEGEREECGSSSAGGGQTMSLDSSGQNSRILFNKYHFRWRDKPTGTIGDGVVRKELVDDFRRLTWTYGESALSRTKTYPGEFDVNRIWCSFFIPFNLKKDTEKKDCQSKDGTNTCPSSDPTNWAKFTLADVLTTSTRSVSLPTFVL